MPWVEAAAVVALGAAAAFTQSVSGFGFSLLIVPPLSLVVGAKDGVVLANTMGTFVNLIMAARLRGHVDRGLFLRMFAAACAGMPLGLVILTVLDSAVLQAAIALVVMVSAVLVWRRVRVPATGRSADAAAGLLSGVLNTSTSMSGPPVVLYLQGKGVAPDSFRATLGAYFLASGLVAVGLFVLGGRYDGSTWAEAALSAPALAGGWLAGTLVYGRLDAGRFQTLVIGVLFLTAVIALATAVA